MSDELSNATRIAALEEQVRQLQTAYVEVACENARLTNDMGIISNHASMDREEIDSMAKRNDELRADIQHLRSMYEERSEYAERLLSENVRLSNEAAEVRKDLANYRVRLERSETVLDSTRQSIITACTGSGCVNASELRFALDQCREHGSTVAAQLTSERERCGVLEREIGKWRAWCDAEDSVAISEPLLLQDVVNARKATDTRHALDAAKFVGGG